MAIPTKYNHVMFRSRLEAQWAAMFDLMQWKWHYEPIDLKGYIPDFVLFFEREKFLVEIKPALDNQEILDSGAIEKIRGSGWTGAAVILGALPEVTCVVHNDSHEFVDCDQTYQGIVRLRSDTEFPHWSLYRDYGGGEGCRFCMVCGCDEAAYRTSDEDRAALWAEAGNITQWQAPR